MYAMYFEPHFKHSDFQCFEAVFIIVIACTRDHLRTHFNKELPLVAISVVCKSHQIF